MNRISRALGILAAVIIAAALVFSIGSCAKPSDNPPAPVGGSMICVRNVDHQPFTIVAQQQDGTDVAVWDRLQPGGSAHFRWPWPMKDGRLRAGGVWWTEYFSPWTESHWTWLVGATQTIALRAGDCPVTAR